MYLISCVKNLLYDLNGNETSNKLIIFSLFGNILKSIATRLEMIGIKSSMLVGNVYARRRAMSAFQTKTKARTTNEGKNKEESIRVMLISIKHAASGANLTEATHVILCDAVSGSTSEAYSSERQAIGRAVRQGMSLNDRNENYKKITKVLRFVVKNTIEHETHERNEKIRMKQCSEKKH